jgi:hypothetical protein
MGSKGEEFNDVLHDLAEARVRLEATIDELVESHRRIEETVNQMVNRQIHRLRRLPQIKSD